MPLIILTLVRRITAPWQLAFDFQLQGQTEECADENDHSQHEHVLQGGRDNNGPDNVASNKKLETEQNRASNILPVKRIIIAGVVHAMKNESASGYDRAAHNDKYAYAVHASTDDFHDVPKIFHGHDQLA